MIVEKCNISEGFHIQSIFSYFKDFKDTCCHRNCVLASNGIVIRERLSCQKVFIQHVHAKFLSCVQLFAILWTVAHEASLSMGFSGKRILEWVCHALLQGIFLTQRLNPCLQHLLLLLVINNMGSNKIISILIV